MTVRVPANQPVKKAEEAPVDRARRGLVARISILTILLFLGAGKVLHRAYDIQVHRPKQYERHYREEIEIEQKRGNIYDRNGAELAVSVDLDSFYADPVALREHHIDPVTAATALAPVLGLDAAQLLTKLNTNKRFVWLKRRVSPTQSQAVQALGFAGKGIGARKEPRRYYPNLNTAAHLLGFTDEQGHGVEGLERRFETRLRGATDKVSAIVDARGGVLFSAELLDQASARGQDLTLTLDREVQILAERELELGVRAVEARAGSVVVMDPTTGEILALANYPTFNPNDPGAADPSNRRNRAVTDRFEPGSVIKAFTVAGALATGAVSPSQQIDCENGAMQVAEYTIHDSHHYESLTPAEILAYSSNIGTAKIGASMGRAGLFRALRRFGFGARTDVELPAEAEGILRHYKRWYDMDAATISFGQGMSVTSLQLATAMAALANGGRLMKPILVSRVTDATGQVTEEFAPSVKRQVVPAHVARLTSDMLTAVTAKGGTGEGAAVPGYVVAGKTGTAQKADYARGGYAEDHWTATFVGFVPANKPRLVISVVIDEPIIEHYGGSVAGPVFRRVAEQTLRHLGVPPAQGGTKLAEIVKTFKAEKSKEAAVAAEAEVPTIEAKETPGEKDAPLAADQVRVPSLKGLGMRTALVKLRKLDLLGQLSGSGAVVEQSPKEGTVVPKGTAIDLIFKRPDSQVDEADAPRAPVLDGETLAVIDGEGAAP